MAFVKLLPIAGADAWSVTEVIRRLQDEFEFVDIDSDRGKAYFDCICCSCFRVGAETLIYYG
jgi:hypothetical protein